MKKLTINLIAIVLLISNLSSCSLFLPPNSHFEGGQILDKDLMSEIRSEVFTETQEADTKQLEETEASENKETVQDDTTEDETHQKIEIDNDTTVYWTDSGKVWHLFENCGYLKNSKEILSGTLADAEEEGKEKICSSCEKKND